MGLLTGGTSFFIAKLEGSPEWAGTMAQVLVTLLLAIAIGGSVLPAPRSVEETVLGALLAGCTALALLFMVLDAANLEEGPSAFSSALAVGTTVTLTFFFLGTLMARIAATD